MLFGHQKKTSNASWKKQNTRNTLMSGYSYEWKTFDARDKNTLNKKPSKSNVKWVKEKLTNLDFSESQAWWVQPTHNKSDSKHSTSRKRQAFSTHNADKYLLIAGSNRKYNFGPTSHKSKDSYTGNMNDAAYRLLHQGFGDRTSTNRNNQVN